MLIKKTCSKLTGTTSFYVVGQTIPDFEINKFKEGFISLFRWKIECFFFSFKPRNFGKII